MIIRFLLPLATVATLAMPALAQESPPAFEPCSACHTGDPDALGPDLTGVVGRKSGSLPDFRYSAAMKRSNLTWDPDTLKRYLIDPQGVVPGNRMPMGPIPPDQADQVIGYLKTLK